MPSQRKAFAPPPTIGPGARRVVLGRAVTAVLTDTDDTLTRDGAVETSESSAALRAICAMAACRSSRDHRAADGLEPGRSCRTARRLVIVAENGAVAPVPRRRRAAHRSRAVQWT